MWTRVLLATLAIASIVSASKRKQSEPCFWMEFAKVGGQSTAEYLCDDVADASSVTFAVSSVSGYDEFRVLVLADSDYDAWRRSDNVSTVSDACVNREDCVRSDAYSKSGSYNVAARGSPYHVVIANTNQNVSDAAEFDVTVSISVGEVETVGAVQLTGSTSGPTPGGTGIDVSAPICASMSSSDWQCIAKAGYTYVTIQGWAGGHQYNKALATCASDASAAGLSVDVYIFMCPNCAGNSDASQTVNTFISNMKSDGVTFGTMWFDVEQCSGCWNSPTQNAQYVAAGVSEAQSMGASIGIYSSLGEWSQTVGTSTDFNSLPLWYAHYDGQANFNDASFYHFGGWTSAARKQYSGSGSVCGVSVDLDWAPSA